MHSLRTSLFAVLLGVSSFGCAGIGHDIAKGTTPGVIEGTADAISDKKTQEKVVNGLDEKLIEDATRKMSSGVVDGTLDTLTSPERLERMQNLAAAAMEPVIRTVDGAVAGAIDTTFAHAFSDEALLKMRLLVRTMVADVVSQVVASVKSEMGTPEEREAAIGATVRTVTREAALGFQDAVDITAKEKEKGKLDKNEGNLLNAVNDAATSGHSILFVAGGLVLALLVALVITLVVMTRRRRLHQTEVAERDASLLLLAQAIKSTEGQPWSSDFRSTLQKTFEDSDGNDYLLKLLSKKGAKPEGRSSLPHANGAGHHS